jgi:hypothetical protein
MNEEVLKALQRRNDMQRAQIDQLLEQARLARRDAANERIARMTAELKLEGIDEAAIGSESGRLTPDGERVLLERLRVHFGEPVKPLGFFCKAMTTWLRVQEQASEEAKKRATAGSLSSHDRHPKNGDWAEHVPTILLSIHKSYLLWRLMYEDQPLRYFQCPKHKGHWDGQAQLFVGCDHGCAGSGFVENPAWLKTNQRVTLGDGTIATIHNLCDDGSVTFVVDGAEEPHTPWRALSGAELDAVKPIENAY